MTRSLPQDVVADLVDRILAANHGVQTAIHEEAQPSVVHQRIADIRSGKIEGIPYEETPRKSARVLTATPTLREAIRLFITQFLDDAPGEHFVYFAVSWDWLR